MTLEVATPLGLVLSTEVESIAAPSVQGELGVFAGHLPLLAALDAGVIRYEIDGKTHLAAVGPGFVDAEPDRVQILTDAFTLPEDVDVDAVRAELADAEARLDGIDKDDYTIYLGPAVEEIRRDHRWAEARLAIVEGA